MNENVLEMHNIEKQFNGVPVLKKMNFSLKKGEVHALLGGNGAGKSTLMKILNGVYTKDAGQIRIDGQEADLHSVEDAHKKGIAMIYQEFSLLPAMSVAENIYITREWKKGGLIDDRKNMKKAEELLKWLEIDNIDPRVAVESLDVGYWQMVEIAKALSQDAKILVMDEPTSSLSKTETKALFKVIRQLKEKGISIIYISHRMAEVFEICDRVTILRDGVNVATVESRDTTMEEIIDKMLDAAAKTSFERVERNFVQSGDPVLRVRDFAYGNKLADVSFDLYPGEILGLAGLMGSGRTELVESIFGIRRNWTGDVAMRGEPIKSKKDAMNKGIALVPEDRRQEGLILQHSIKSNFMLPSVRQMRKGFLIDDKKGADISREYIEKLSIKADSIKQMAMLLSGGNQQKIVLGKWLARGPRVLILDEPTIGVDVAAKAEILRIIRQLADEGVAVLMISSELSELVAACDRILVLYNRTVNKELSGREIESEEVLHHAIQGL